MKDIPTLSMRFKAILAAVPDIIMQVDVNKICTWANPAGLNFFGADVIGKQAAYYLAGEPDNCNSEGIAAEKVLTGEWRFSWLRQSIVQHHRTSCRTLQFQPIFPEHLNLPC